MDGRRRVDGGGGRMEEEWAGCRNQSGFDISKRKELNIGRFIFIGYWWAQLQMNRDMCIEQSEVQSRQTKVGTMGRR